MSPLLEQAKGQALQVEAREAFKKEIKDLQHGLAALQQPLKEAGIPVILLFEGWSAAGKGRMISKVISQLDPRGYQVYSNTDPEEGEARRPFLWRFWRDIPPKGEMAVLDRSWYTQAAARLEEERGEAKELLDSLCTFERQLADDGYLVLKFFLHIGQKEQRDRLEKLAGSKTTAWRVTDRDWRNNRNYRTKAEEMDLLLEATHRPWAPWHVVWNEDRDLGVAQVLRIIHRALTDALAGGRSPVSGGSRGWKGKELTMPLLEQVDLDRTVDEETYDRELKREKKKLEKLHGQLYRARIPVVIGFEGWDAAGKGGAIRRLSWALDPRGFDVIPIAAPDKDELNRHYLWRFWKQLPKDGHVAIFDRTWYGRVMVERIEGFTPECRWAMAYDEINEFEQELTDWGAVVLKFWLQIDPEEQLRRFEARQNTPEKRYKITEEDWRNREKWPAYQVAVDEMLQKTSTERAPWIIVEGNDKKYARLKVLRTVRRALEARLEGKNKK